MLTQEIALAVAKVIGLYIIVSYIPRPWLHNMVLKHPFWCDMFCMFIVPIPLLAFGGVKGMAAAVFFALAMSISIKIYRWYLQRPATTEHKVRWWKIQTADGAVVEHNTTEAAGLPLWWTAIVLGLRVVGVVGFFIVILPAVFG